MREFTLPVSGASVWVRSTAEPAEPVTAAGAPAEPRPVFVLVHGIGMSHRYLRRLQAVLAGAGTTHAVDLPGFGRSPRPTQGVTIERYADYLGELLPQLSDAPVVLVGHSMGAQFVTETAARYPELVAQLVLIGAVTDPTRDTAVQQARALARDTLKEPLAGTLITFVDYLRCGPRWYLSALGPMLEYRTDLRLRQVTAPTLVLRGDRDPVSHREWAEHLAAQSAGIRLAEVPGRHLVQFSAPAATAAAIVSHARPAPTALPDATARPAPSSG